MPKYTLLYFDGRGRAELTRLCFALAGVEYEDKRITDWPSLKPKTPFGFLPVLEIEGGPTLTESLVVAQYVAEEFGIGGKNALEQAQVRMVVAHLNELMTEILTPIFEKDEDKKAAMMKKVKEETAPKFLGNVEKILKANNDGKGFMFGDSATTADLMVYIVLTDVKGADLVSGFDLLKGLAKRVGEIPAIAAWVAKRPESPW